MTELYDRAKLLGEIWSEPVQVVTPRYALSDAGLKKLCMRLQIATPPRGYWAKVKAGKRLPPRPKLREYKGPAIQLYRRESQQPRPPKEASDSRLEAILAFERQPEHHITVPEHVTRWHSGSGRSGVAQNTIYRHAGAATNSRQRAEHFGL